MAYIIFACLELIEILGPRIFEWYSVDGLSKTFFFIVCACVCEHTHSTCEGQRTACESFVFPFTTWVLGIELRGSGLAASAFPC